MPVAQQRKSRNDDLMVAVGFIPRSNAFRFPRVAERRMNVWRDGSVQPTLRDGNSAGLRTVG
jgi:hypothetical protein